jgi:hypothetical protein
MPVRNLGGWRIDKEDFDYLHSLSGEDQIMALCGSYTEVAIDPRKVMRIENQGPVGACQGHSISSGCEWIYILVTGDTTLQLSRAYGYYESQRIDGLLGRDAGSTIQAGVKLAMEKGICPEVLWPYQNKYAPTPPRPIQELYDAAAKYKIAKSVRLTSYDAIRTFLGSGQGMVHLGIPWNSSVDKAVVPSYYGGNSGGHSIGLYALSDRKDSQGRPYLWMMNSWSESWGNHGWAEWSPDAISAMLKQQWAVFVGISDMPEVKPREWTLKDTEDTVKWWLK